MKTAVCYYSRHHGNTRKVLDAMADEGNLDLIDVTTRQTVRLEEYDCIGFASGIYGFDVQKAVVEFARQYLPQGKSVFFVYTYDTLIPFYLIFFMVFSPKYSEKRLIYTMYFYSPDFLAPFWHRKILKKFSSTVAGFCSANFILHRQFQTVIIRTWVLP